MVVYRTKCEICGKDVLAKRAGVAYCQDKSSCRVAAYRKREKARKQADELTLDMGTYAFYQHVVKTYPLMEGALLVLLNKHGKQALTDFLAQLAGDLQV